MGIRTAVLVVGLLTYAIAEYYEIGSIDGALSPLVSFFSAALLLEAYLKCNRTNRASLSFLFYIFACLAWTIADVFCLLEGQVGHDPRQSLTEVLYVLAGLLILAGLSVFAISQFSKWNTILLMLDAVILGLISVILLWLVYFHKDLPALLGMMQSDRTSALSIFVDISLVIGILLWFVSVRTSKVPAFMWIIAGGAILYSLTDTLYYYQFFSESRIDYSLADFLYSTSLATIAFGSVWKTYRGKTPTDFVQMNNIESDGKWFLLFGFPFLALFLDQSGWVTVEMNPFDFIVLILLVFLYRGANQYVRLAIENERLLKNEIEHNLTLEKRVEEQVKELSFLSNKDPLTSLFNRGYFFRALEESVDSVRVGETVAVVLVNLDRFKSFNSTYGHEGGDTILSVVAERFRLRKCNHATIARLGSDEFVFLFEGKITQKEVENCCNEILRLCNEPISIGSDAVQMTVSMGVAMLTESISEGKILMKNADTALNYSKSQGYNRYQFYDPILVQSINQKHEIEFMLRQAVAREEFEIYYQPQFTIPDKTLVGAEALLRWKTPEHGYIPPSVFIPVAEETNFIVPIGRWVIENAIRQAADWNRKYPVKVSFNISPKQLNDQMLLDHFSEVILASGVNTHWISAEVTESILITEESRARVLFEVLNDLGVTINMDDFGSGYSSLGYLNKYNFDKIKIDKSLVDNLTAGNVSGINVARAVISLAKGVGAKTIAEGVETQEQLDILVELGCDQVQGYLLGRPVPVEVFERDFLGFR